jgi:hypothetical protein
MDLRAVHILLINIKKQNFRWTADMLQRLVLLVTSVKKNGRLEKMDQLVRNVTRMFMKTGLRSME